MKRFFGGLWLWHEHRVPADRVSTVSATSRPADAAGTAGEPHSRLMFAFFTSCS
jgi:hypothetical protein